MVAEVQTQNLKLNGKWPDDKWTRNGLLANKRQMGEWWTNEQIDIEWTTNEQQTAIEVQANNKLTSKQRTMRTIILGK